MAKNKQSTEVAIAVDLANKSLQINTEGVTQLTKIADQGVTIAYGIGAITGFLERQTVALEAQVLLLQELIEFLSKKERIRANPARFDMSKLTSTDIGRWVEHRPLNCPAEQGRIVRWDHEKGIVFVVFSYPEVRNPGPYQGIACKPENLTFL